MTPAQLQAHWYRILRQSGFHDAEARDGSMRDRNRLARVVALSPIVRQANAEYFELCTAYLDFGGFASAMERQAWELHADGQSVREIADVLRCSKDWVQRNVSRHRRLMRAAKTTDCAAENSGTEPGEG